MTSQASLAPLEWLQDFHNINRKENQLPFFCLSAQHLPPCSLLQVTAGKCSHACAENIVEGRAGHGQEKGWLPLKLPRARAPKTEGELSLRPERSEGNISPLSAAAEREGYIMSCFTCFKAHPETHTVHSGSSLLAGMAEE